ncbi:MAG: EamA family transporter [Alphaproteobacteria bacterium]
MTTFVFFMVLSAAVLHASWNALIKGGADRYATIMILSLGHMVCGFVAVFFVAFPTDPIVWALIVASAFVHVGYKLTLARAYNLADFSLVYPLARGAAPLLTALFSYLFLAEHIAPLSALGIAILAGGIILLGWSKKSSPDRAGIVAALCVSVFICGYTILDGLGGRLAASPHSYIFYMFIIDGVFTMIFFGLFYRQNVRNIQLRDFGLGMVGGVASMFAYWIVVWAMAQAPMGSVAALRETSVLVAMLISVVFLKEMLTKRRMVSALLIVLGVVLLKIA